MNDDPRAERLRVAELLGDMARRFLALPASAVENGIKEALEAVVKTTGFDRGVVVAFDRGMTRFTVTHRYPEIDPRSIFALGSAIPVTRLPWLVAQMTANREVAYSGGLDRMPPEAHVDGAIFQEAGVSSLACFPLQIAGQLIGSLAFTGELAWDVEHVKALRVVAQLFAAAIDRLRSDEERQHRLRMSELIGDVSRRFIALPATELGRGIDEALMRIAEFSGFLRAIVHELSEDGRYFSLTHRYLADGVEGMTPLNTEAALDRYSYVVGRLATKEPIVLSPDGLPETAYAEREEVERGGRLHIVLLPFIVGGEVIGAVSFEMVDHPDPRIVESLEVIGELFASAVHREQADRALRQRLRFEEALSEISASLLGSTATSFDAVLGDAMRTLGQALEFERVGVFRMTDEGRIASISHQWSASEVESFGMHWTRIRIDEFGWPFPEIRQGRTIVYGPEDVPEGAVHADRQLGESGPRLLVLVPLIVTGEVVGFMAFHRMQSARRPSEHQQTRLRLVGSTIGGAIARRTTEASLRRTEAHFAQVVASALDGFAMVNEAGIVLEWTVQAEKILGFRRGEMLGMPLSEVLAFAGSSSEGVTPRELHRRAQPSGRLELHGRPRDGRPMGVGPPQGSPPEIPIELSISVLEGDPVRYAVFVRDITERKRTELVRQQAFDEISRLKVQIEGERDYLREEIRADHRVGEFVGRSRALQHILDLVESVASTSASVLVRGESGVGKEVVARAIHARSRRADGPLVKVNCASIPKELFESEFFGHVRGAFTGALKDRAGRFELADRGTIFLDEVGEIPMDLQAKLLRVLQESEFERVGDDRTRKVDARVVAATNRDLEAEAAAGRFRKDLYYRLSVFPIEVPPLRDRRDDIVPLAEHFLARHARDLGRVGLTLGPEHRQALESYDWPGNVRELQHVIQRAVILAREPPLRLELTPPVTPPPMAGVPTAGRILTDAELRAMEQSNILEALERCGWRIAGAGGAAELLGINPSTLRDRMRSYDIQRRRGGSRDQDR